MPFLVWNISFGRRHPRWVDQTGLSAGTLLRETLVRPIWDPAWNWTGGITGTRECHWGGSQRGRWSVIGGLIKARPVCEHVLKSVSKGGWFDLKMFQNDIRATSQNWVLFSKFSTCSIWKLKYCLLSKRDSPRGQRQWIQDRWHLYGIVCVRLRVDTRCKVRETAA